MDDMKLITALTNLWAAGAPPASDPRFVLDVMTRIERRRFRRELAMTIGLAVCAIVLLGILAPMLEFTWNNNFAPYASNLAVMMTLISVTLAVPYFFPARD
jgi:hypothetical protein